MQYEEPEKIQTTKITFRSDWPTGLSSRLHGANLNTIGFNMDYLAEHAPELIPAVQRLYREADAVRERVQVKQQAA